MFIFQVDNRPKEKAPLKDWDKEFVKLFNSQLGKINAWTAWQSIIGGIACGLANVGDVDKERRDKREAEYARCAKAIGEDTLAEAMAIIVNALDRNPEQDFLGKIFMDLGLGSNWNGQFFTPFSTSKLMSEMSINDDVLQRIKDKGWGAVHDPACGAGSTLIGAVSVLMHSEGVNYQRQVLFIGQDLDRTVAQMCYIQLSLLGCAGYVVVGDTLSNPIEGDVLFPAEKEDQEFWYTPLWWDDIWTGRRWCHYLDTILRHKKEA